MSKVTWVPEISLGHVITVAVTLVSLATAWQSLSSRVEAHTTEIVSIKSRLDKHDKDLAETKDVAAQDRLEQTKILTELRTDLRYLRQMIEKYGAPK